MTNEELCYQIQNSDNKTEYIEQLYLQNYGLICKVANRFTRFYELDDLIQEGALGLLAAAELFNENYRVKFSTYAAEIIKSHILRFLENNGNAIRLPVHRIASIRNAGKVSEEFYKVYGHEPSVLELAEVMRITPEQARKVLIDASMLNLKSINEPISEQDDSGELEDIVRDPSNGIEDLEKKLQNEQLKAVLWPMVNSLPEDQATVIHMRYEGNMTGKEIADVMGVSVGVVRKHEDHAIRELRKNRNTKRLRSFFPDETIYTRSLHYCGSRRFVNTWTSAPEQMILMAERDGMI